MLEQLPVHIWLELNDKFRAEHIHVAELLCAEIGNYEDTEFELIE